MKRIQNNKKEYERGDLEDREESSTGEGRGGSYEKGAKSAEKEAERLPAGSDRDLEDRGGSGEVMDADSE